MEIAVAKGLHQSELLWVFWGWDGDARSLGRPRRTRAAKRGKAVARDVAAAALSHLSCHSG